MMMNPPKRTELDSGDPTEMQQRMPTSSHKLSLLLAIGLITFAALWLARGPKHSDFNLVVRNESWKKLSYLSLSTDSLNLSLVDLGPHEAVHQLHESLSLATPWHYEVTFDGRAAIRSRSGTVAPGSARAVTLSVRSNGSVQTGASTP